MVSFCSLFRTTVYCCPAFSHHYVWNEVLQSALPPWWEDIQCNLFYLLFEKAADETRLDPPLSVCIQGPPTPNMHRSTTLRQRWRRELEPSMPRAERSDCTNWSKGDEERWTKRTEQTRSINKVPAFLMTFITTKDSIFYFLNHWILLRNAILLK